MQKASREFSPRQVAEALGVSESSLKRWCDRGMLPMRKTAGGHRRLHQADIVRFVREHDHPLARPEIIGLPARAGDTHLTAKRALEVVLPALTQGDGETVRQTILALFTASISTPVIFDEVLAEAFHAVGDRWQHGDLEIYAERRACVIAMDVLLELRRLLPTSEREPLAFGATLEGDVYTIAVTMGELVLRENGWNAHLLGSGIPATSIAQALLQYKPPLLWLSVNHIARPETFVSEVNAICDVAKETGTAVVIGGRALDESTRKQLRHTAHCDSLAQLASLARSMK